jgi:enoyl-CoA hydratase/carnithine racemase
MANGLRVEQDGATTTIWIDRAARRNALNLECWTAIAASTREAEARTDCLMIVIRGTEGNFGSGADISEFAEQFSDADSIRSYFAAMETAMASIENVSKPTIAAIEGSCFGASVALSLACDIRIASAESIFAITPAKLGISYPYGDVRRVLRAIGPGRTKSLLFSGRRVSAGEAFAIGLIDQMEDAGNFENALTAMENSIAESSQHSIRASKAAVSALLKGLDHERAGYPEALVTAIQGEDFQEGMTAFIDKRKPAFRYR